MSAARAWRCRARLPYAGELVFTAFSGSHQDAIKKSWAAAEAGRSPGTCSTFPSIPADIGRTYKAIIRINSQSGKGGVAYVMEKEFGYDLPKAMHKEFGRVINDLADERKTEITPQEIHEAFRPGIHRAGSASEARAFPHHRARQPGEVRGERSNSRARSHKFTGAGNGPIDAFVNGLDAAGVPGFELLCYSEHSLGRGAEARAVAYIQVKTGRGRTYFGAGIDTNIELRRSRRW